jgi:hypothetical protein
VIVVDSNVIAYCWLNGPLTALAQGVRVKALPASFFVTVLYLRRIRVVCYVPYGI